MAGDTDKLSHRKLVTAWNSGHVFPLQFNLNLFDRNVEFKLPSSPGTFQKYSLTCDRALVLQYPNLSSNIVLQFLQEMYIAHVSSAFKCTPKTIKLETLETTTLTYQPLNKDMYGRQWEIYCAGQGTVLHEVIHVSFSSVILCRMMFKLRECKPKLIVSLKNASSQILYAHTAHVTLTSRSYKGTSWMAWGFPNTNICH